jgi:hypothetical protein
MKLFVALYVFLTLSMSIHAAQTFTVVDVGISISMPDDWIHDSKDSFGFLIHPANEDRKKIRLHYTEYKGISAEEAMLRAVEKIKKIREENKNDTEHLLGSVPITTKSGIKGQKATLGTAGVAGPSYLDRYYFEKPDGKIFCVCVYHLGDAAFAEASEKNIVETLKFTK